MALKTGSRISLLNCTLFVLGHFFVPTELLTQTHSKDVNTPLHLMQPDNTTPYGQQSDNEISANLVRVYYFWRGIP